MDHSMPCSSSPFPGARGMWGTYFTGRECEGGMKFRKRTSIHRIGCRRGSCSQDGGCGSRAWPEGRAPSPGAQRGSGDGAERGVGQEVEVLARVGETLV